MGFYLLIAVILFMTVFALRGGDTGQLEITYGQIRRLLEEQQVSQVSLQDDGALTLWLKEPVDGQAAVRYDVGDPDWFREDFNELIVVEDILDSGNTLSYLLQLLQARKPASVRLCTLLDKPSRRVKPVELHYSGFTIPDYFVVGYGLDYDEKYRNLPYIGVLKPSVYGGE